MTEVLVLAEGAQRPSDISPDLQCIEVTTTGASADPNTRFEITGLRSRLLKEIPPRLEDFLRIAAVVYRADTKVQRWTETDAFADKWKRSFTMVIPVLDLEFWRSQSIADSLALMLSFLTGDRFTFRFIERHRNQPHTQFFKELTEEKQETTNTVIAFSGGADSLAAVIDALQSGRRPILAGHQPAPKIGLRQENLVTLLKQRFPESHISLLKLVVNRQSQGVKRNHDYKEFSQRSRSFLYVALLSAAAKMLEIDDIRLCDNGVVSVNLPQSGQNLGTFLSRSTHPKYLADAQKFIREVTERSNLTLQNTLLFKTKKEILEIINQSGNPDLIQETVSCAHTETSTNLQPHCGVCTQCIDRRFASIAANLEEHDLKAKYEKDIFDQALTTPESKAHSENYIRFAMKLEKLETLEAFFETYPELYDCLPDTHSGQIAQEIFHLFQRHQRAVNQALEKKLQEYAPELRRNSLPADCLLKIVAKGISDEPGIQTQTQMEHPETFLREPPNLSLLDEDETLKALNSIGDNEHNINRLAEKLATPSVIPFVGAGLSMPFGMPSWKDFLLKSATGSLRKEITRLLKENKYEEAANYLLKELSPRRFQDRLDAEFGNLKLKGANFSETAAGVVPKLATAGPVITTNFDQVMEKSFETAQKPFEKILIGGTQTDWIAQAIQTGRSFLLKIHGDVEDRTERILTGDEYDKHYGSNGGVDFNKPLPKHLQLMLRARSLLFLGCSLDKDRLTTILRQISDETAGVQHYAIVPEPKNPKKSLERVRELGELGITAIWYPVGEHRLIKPLLECLVSKSKRSR
jgi:hypothetical protein